MTTLDRREIIGAALAAMAAGVTATRPRSATAADGGGNSAPGKFKRISTEEAFITADVAVALTRKLGESPEKVAFSGTMRAPLLDIAEGRIKTMDEAGVDIQLLSLTAPGLNPLDPEEASALAVSANDELHAAIQKHPDRFTGLAAIPPQAPDAAARELQRAVTKLGLKGAIINGSSGGVYLDNPRHDPIWEAAQALDVPVYIHPRMPSPKLQASLIPGFLISFGFAVEAGTNVARMMSAKVFDRYPRLRIVLGHLGENLPFVIDRMDSRYAWELAHVDPPKLDRKPSEYLRSNIFFTTSGQNFTNPIMCTVNSVGIDRVIFAADYPYEDQKEAVDGALGSPLPANEMAMVFEGNARRLFKI